MVFLINIKKMKQSVTEKVKLIFCVKQKYRND